MTFLIFLIGWILVLCDLFFFPSLFRFSLYIDISFIWVLFSMDIQQEDSIYTFLSVMLMKTLFLTHTLVIPYLISFTLFYCLYYFALPFFYQKETWLSFSITQVFFITYMIWLNRFGMKAVLFSICIEIIFFFLLVLVRKAFRTTRKINKGNFITAT